MKIIKIDSAIMIPLCAVRSYGLFVLINGGLLVLISDISDPNNLAAGIMLALIIFILGPLNTLILLLMYWLNINKRFLMDYRYTLLESIIFWGCGYILPSNTNAFVLYLSAFFIPIVITAGTGFLLKKYGKRFRFRKRKKSQ